MYILYTIILYHVFLQISPVVVMSYHILDILHIWSHQLLGHWPTWYGPISLCILCEFHNLDRMCGHTYTNITSVVTTHLEPLFGIYSQNKMEKFLNGQNPAIIISTISVTLAWLYITGLNFSKQGDVLLYYALLSK